jgi:hypothetical protein
VTFFIFFAAAAPAWIIPGNFCHFFIKPVKLYFIFDNVNTLTLSNIKNMLSGRLLPAL